MEHLDSLPPYTVRRSTRARHVRLTVSAKSGLVVVLPNRWRGDVDAVVASKRVWASRALARVAPKRALYLAGPEALVPQRIELRTQARALEIDYRTTAATGARASERDGVLIVSGSSDARVRLEALQRWLVAEGRRSLPERLVRIAETHGLSTPSAVRISTAGTRWGSCSAKRSISLNRTLVLMPPELCDYVIAHELVHLEHLNHSPRFWSRLAQIDARALEHRAAMKEAGRLIPAWVDA